VIVCAIDIGTTSTKGMLCDLSGRILAEASAEYPLTSTKDGRAEQDPELIVEATLHVVKTLCSGRSQGEVAAISLSAAMHSLILLDESGRALTPSITWADRRASRVARELRESEAGRAMYRRTGTPIHPMAWPAKLAYLRRTDAATFARARHFVGIKEFLLLRVTGELCCDQSIASATGLYQLASGAWDEGAMAFAGVNTRQLPVLCATTTRLVMSADYCTRLGLNPGTPIVIGAGDGCLSNLGAGAIAHGQAALTVGTSAALRCVFPSPRTDRDMRTFCYVLTEDRFVCGGAVNGGGVALRWARDELARTEKREAMAHGADAYAELAALAASIAPGSEGLMFHPYLAGERAPLWNPDALASFIGLTLAHRKEHMIRAVMEGVLMNLFVVLSAIESANEPIQRILAVGGFARSPFWCQMLSDVFNRPIEFPRSHESSALGAARLAFYALGAVSSLDEFDQREGEAEVLRPDPIAAEQYAKMHPIYERVPHLLAPVYRALSDL
jgi:gluconokinase